MNLPQRDGASHKQSTSPTKKVTMKQESTAANSRPKNSAIKTKCSSPLQLKINTIRSKNKPSKENFYKNVNFKPEFYGLNAYCPGMNSQVLEKLLKDMRKSC